MRQWIRHSRGMWTWLFGAGAICLAICLSAGIARAQGGPPLLTDDPGTPGPGHWEINVATTYTGAGGAWTTELPLIDANYGIGEAIQLKIEIPWLIDHPVGTHSRVGSGNMLLGVKWRFLDQGEEGFAISVYPQVELQAPGSMSYRRGIVEPAPALLLPIEAIRRLGPVELNAEAGYQVERLGGSSLFYGLAVGHVVTARVELLAEVHGESALFNEQESLFNVGGRFTLTPHCLLLVSGGHSLRAPGGTSGGPLGYAAVQLLL